MGRGQSLALLFGLCPRQISENCKPNGKVPQVRLLHEMCFHEGVHTRPAAWDAPDRANAHCSKGLKPILASVA